MVGEIGRIIKAWRDYKLAEAGVRYAQEPEEWIKELDEFDIEKFRPLQVLDVTKIDGIDKYVSNFLKVLKLEKLRGKAQRESKEMEPGEYPEVLCPLALGAIEEDDKKIVYCRKINNFTLCDAKARFIEHKAEALDIYYDIYECERVGEFDIPTGITSDLYVMVNEDRNRKRLFELAESKELTDEQLLAIFLDTKIPLEGLPPKIRKLFARKIREGKAEIYNINSPSNVVEYVSRLYTKD